MTLFAIASNKSRLSKALLALCCLFSAGALTNKPAHADFRLCNQTDNKISVAIGFKGKDGWKTEGWWNFDPATDENGCKVILPGSLQARFYYLYAIDITAGGEWGGSTKMCTQPKQFTVTGIQDCFARGYEQTGFFEVDTGQQNTWTVQLTDLTDKG